MTPLLPDGDQAREWAERELAHPAYDAVEPTALDRAARAVGDVLLGLLDPDLSGGWGPLAAVLATVAVVAIILVVVLIWGRPRRRMRTPDGPPTDLFGADEVRTAAQLRADAAAAAARGAYDDAVILGFRALARGLVERAVVTPLPGTTARSFARQAGRAFPDLGGALSESAAVFDDVRYLRRPATADLATRIAELDRRVTALRPVHAEVEAR